MADCRNCEMDRKVLLFREIDSNLPKQELKYSEKETPFIRKKLAIRQ